MLPIMLLVAVGAVGCTSRFDKSVAASRDGMLLGDGRAAVVYSPSYEINLGGLENTHPFDIHKYNRMARALVADGYLASDEFYVPNEVTREQLLLVHTPKYLRSLRSSGNVARYLESKAMKWLPSKTLDDGVLRAFRHATGGTILAARLALRCGLAINLGGGYHHAHPDRGEGFCIYADVPIAIRTLQREGRIRRALLVDLDVHQGNGNAVCFAGDDDVYTFSIHQKDIYPTPKARSDLDVELLPPVDDKRYHDVLHEHLPKVLEASMPDLVVLLGGVDVLAGDPLARFSMTPDGIEYRDAYVVALARAYEIPVVYVTSGGYSDRAWEVQYGSIANLLETFGGVRPRPPAGKASGKMKVLLDTSYGKVKGK
jgi:histone deacetylase 11